mgnify:CR=1 FL=1
MEQKMERDGLASIAESSYLPVNFCNAEKAGDLCLPKSLPGAAVVRR